jgi:hypothetical protein
VPEFPILDPDFISSVYLRSLHFGPRFQRHRTVFRVFVFTDEVLVNGDCQLKDVLDVAMCENTFVYERNVLHREVFFLIRRKCYLKVSGHNFTFPILQHKMC